MKNKKRNRIKLDYKKLEKECKINKYKEINNFPIKKFANKEKIKELGEVTIGF